MAIFYKNDCVYAQSDSLKVEYKQESTDSSNYSLKPKYKFLNLYLKEEKNLIKIGFKPLTMLYKTSYSNSYMFAASFLFEKKLFTEWSIISEFEYSYGYCKYKMYTPEGYDKYYYHVKKTILNVGVRHYYGMKKAIQQGNNGNNFNGSFFELSINSIPPFNYKHSRQISGSGTTYYSDQIATKVQLAWGIQRKLSNFAFLDTKMHVGYNVYTDPNWIYSKPWYVGLDFTIGFGYNIKRK